MFINDYNAMCAEVYRHQHIETGGNLFGLWTTSGSAIIHVMLGPGQNCKRTSTSFHQDLEYMARVGRFVNDNYMLCHIGEWHSHHNLSLSKPSAGDESTIRRNFPQGMSKFLVIIANIRNGDTIKLSPYFFTDGGARYEIAEYKVLHSDSPFSADAKIFAEINLGAEQNETNYGEALAIETSRNAGSNFHRDVTPTPTYSQALTQSSRGCSKTPHSSTPANDNGISTHKQTTSTSGQPKLPTDHTAAQTNDNPSGSTTVQDQTASSKGDLTTREIVLKEIKDDLERYFGSERPVDIEGAEYGEVQMSFKHGTKHWMLRFPQTFPAEPAQLFWSGFRERLSRASPISSDILLEKPLTSHVNILLSIKKNCFGNACAICKNFTKENLSEPAIAKTASNARLEDVLNAVTNEIKMTEMATPSTLAGEAQSDGSYQIRFEHNLIKWVITLPSDFPANPAEITKKSCYGGGFRKVKYFSRNRRVEESLVTSNLIMLAIRTDCDCWKCKTGWNWVIDNTDWLSYVYKKLHHMLYCMTYINMNILLRKNSISLKVRSKYMYYCL